MSADPYVRDPYVRVERLTGVRSNQRVEAVLGCGHRHFVRAPVRRTAKCVTCGRVARVECTSCGAPLEGVGGVLMCPNAWDRLDERAAPPRGKHA